MKSHIEEWTRKAIEKCRERKDELAARGICYICMLKFEHCQCGGDEETYIAKLRQSIWWRS